MKCKTRSHGIVFSLAFTVEMKLEGALEPLSAKEGVSAQNYSEDPTSVLTLLDHRPAITDTIRMEP